MTFSSLGSPSTTATRPPRALDERRAVGRAGEIARENARRSVGARNACGVCTATSSARDRRVSTTTPSRTRLTRVRDGKHGHGSVEALAERRQEPLDHLVADERTRGVVHEDDERLLGHLGERRPRPTRRASHRR